MKPLILDIPFRLSPPDQMPNLARQAAHLGQTATTLSSFGDRSDAWFLTADTKEEALQTALLDTNKEVSPAALASWETEFDNAWKSVDYRILSIWNGEEDEDGAHLALTYSSGLALSGLDADLPMREVFYAFSHWQLPLMTLIAMFNPLYLSLTPFEYQEHQVFKDCPPVGWMLYLPQVLTTAQVPEARALIPVWDQNLQQQGTIIASVIDQPFDVDNPEHIKIANAIEMRLVDQDLLPTFASLIL